MTANACPTIPGYYYATLINGRDEIIRIAGVAPCLTLECPALPLLTLKEVARWGARVLPEATQQNLVDLQSRSTGGAAELPWPNEDAA